MSLAVTSADFRVKRVIYSTYNLYYEEKSMEEDQDQELDHAGYALCLKWLIYASSLSG